MEFLLLMAGICGLVWGVWFMLRGSLLAGCTAVILVGSTFGYWFWHGEGGVPFTVDRALLGLLVVAYALRRQWVRQAPSP